MKTAIHTVIPPVLRGSSHFGINFEREEPIKIQTKWGDLDVKGNLEFKRGLKNFFGSSFMFHYV